MHRVERQALAAPARDHVERGARRALTARLAHHRRVRLQDARQRTRVRVGGTRIGGAERVGVGHQGLEALGHHG
jgi:hypothetical protein